MTETLGTTWKSTIPKHKHIQISLINNKKVPYQGPSNPIKHTILVQLKIQYTTMPFGLSQLVQVTNCFFGLIIKYTQNLGVDSNLSFSVSIVSKWTLQYINAAILTFLLLYHVSASNHQQPTQMPRRKEEKWKKRSSTDISNQQAINLTLPLG